MANVGGKDEGAVWALLANLLDLLVDKGVLTEDDVAALREQVRKNL